MEGTFEMPSVVMILRFASAPNPLQVTIAELPAGFPPFVHKITQKFWVYSSAMSLCASSSRQEATLMPGSLWFANPPKGN